MDSSGDHFISTRLAKIICAHPFRVLLIAAVLAAAAIALTALRLEFQSDRNALINPDLPWNQRYIDWWEGFPNSADLLVIIDTGMLPASRRSIFTRWQLAQDAARQIEQILNASESIESVFRGAPASHWSEQSARLLPLDRFSKLLREASDTEMLLNHASMAAFIDAIADDIRTDVAQQITADDSAATAERVKYLANVLDSIVAYFPRRVTPIDVLAPPDDETFQPLTSTNSRLIYLLVTPRQQSNSLLAAEDAIETVRHALNHVSRRYTDLHFGLTGVEVIESDETTVAATDSAVASCIALVLISVLLVTSFRSVVTPLLLVGALLIGVAWSFGFLTIAIGHLQVLSVVFVVILLGLGIDFGIHLVSALEHVRSDHDGVAGFPRALAHAFRRCGPGVTFGALTTAAAFFATTFTDFTGVAELGIIASGGIVLCVISMMTVLPALLRMFRSRKENLRHPDDDRIDVFRARWLSPVTAHPTWTVGVVLMALAGAAYSLRNVRFDYDLMALLPRGVESVLWQQRQAENSDESIWHAVSIVDSLEEAAERTRRFRALETVSDVGGIGMLTPVDLDKKLAALDKVWQALQPGLADAMQNDAEQPSGEAVMAELAPAIASLKTQSELAMQTVDPSGLLAYELRRVVSICGMIEHGIDQSRFIAEWVTHYENVERDYREARSRVARRVAALLNPAPLTPNDLPPELLHAAIDRSTPDAPRYALYIYPKVPDGGAASPLSEDFLPRFIEQVRSVDPEVTGVIVQIHESGDLIKHGFMRIGLIALAVVLALTWLTFRSLIDALLALAPVAIGFALTFGMMGVIGVNLNPANIIVLPLMFGIGVDAGIHIMHRVRADPLDRPLGLAHGTGKAITLTALTTMIGFAAMMTARHRGIASLGFVMSLGLGLTLAACWMALPALLEIRLRWRSRTTDGES